LIFALTAFFVGVYCFASCDINKPDEADDDEKAYMLLARIVLPLHHIFDKLSLELCSTLIPEAPS